jgi:hypothetical protein
MSQRKIQRALADLRKELPLSTDDFRKKFEKATGCEFEFDIYAVADDFVFVTDDVSISRYHETVNVAYCGDKSYIVKLGNVIEVLKEVITEKGVIRETWVVNFVVNHVYKEE